MNARDLGETLGVCIDTSAMYKQCAARHAALAAAVKPSNPLNFLGWFK
ncbi:MAG: hypothetical protein K8U57_30535 [Planctomycetes bacterium]|nr:hypothetical protein [Planctomycetota bacterium]